MKCIRKEIIMEIYYDGALVMPKNYAVVDEEEMTYVEGGWSNTIYGSLKSLRTRLDIMIADCLVGDAAAIGIAFGGGLPGVILGGIVGYYFTSTLYYLEQAQAQCETLITKNGKYAQGKLFFTFSTIKLTSATVSIN